MVELFSQSESLSLQRDSWRMFRIISEFVSGFDTFHAKGPFVSIFGSARFDQKNPYCKLSHEIASKLAQNGFSIITGAGPSIMEAANKAAHEAHRGSAGLVPDLPYELEPNPYIDKDLSVKFRYFFIRKVMFVRYSQGFIFLPGGYGTLDELFEILTLVQTKRIQPVPIYLIGTSYWKGLIDWIHDRMIHEGCLRKEELKLFTLTDDLDFIATGLLENYHARIKIHDVEETI
jgi:uncharacterized protein (TIGR00730 family)